MYSTIVIGLDPSDTAHRACEEGAELAKALGAQMHLVAAFADSPGGGLGISEARARAEHMLEGMAAKCDPTGHQVSTHAIPDKPAAAIVAVAEQVGADLIVVGNKGAHGARRVLGSVASAVTNEAPCTVCIVKTT